MHSVYLHPIAVQFIRCDVKLRVCFVDVASFCQEYLLCSSFAATTTSDMDFLNKFANGENAQTGHTTGQAQSGGQSWTDSVCVLQLRDASWAHPLLTRSLANSMRLVEEVLQARRSESSSCAS